MFGEMFGLQINGIDLWVADHDCFLAMVASYLLSIYESLRLGMICISYAIVGLLAVCVFVCHFTYCIFSVKLT